MMDLIAYRIGEVVGWLLPLIVVLIIWRSIRRDKKLSEKLNHDDDGA